MSVFTHPRTLALIVVIAAVITPRLAAQDLTGRWAGAIQIAGTELGIFVEFSGSGEELTATIDIPQQGAAGIPLSNVSHIQDTVHFELPAGPGVAVFHGVHHQDSITGDFTQAGIKGAFVIAREAAGASQPDASEEATNLPYHAEEVTFSNGEIQLAGTLTIPEGAGPHPAVVMITGSGPQNRDEELFGFKLFGVIADSLTREGIAVLRYDDRGVGGSTGNVTDATSEDFAGDVLAAVSLLKARPEIDGTQIGLVGHSEGGVVAPLVAERSSDVAYMVLLAGTALSGDEILFAQGELIMRANGATDDQLAANRHVQEQIFHAIRTGTGWEEVRATLEQQVRAGLAVLPTEQREAIADADAFVNTQVEAQIQSSQTKWLRYFIDYDPAPALARIKVPVLALFGELDLQVPAKANRDRMEKVFTSSQHRSYRLEILPRANHLFLTATTGSPSEYAAMKKEFVPELMPLMISWIHEQAGSSGGH